MQRWFYQEDDLAFRCPDRRTILHADGRRNVNDAKVGMQLFIPSDFCEPLFARCVEKEHMPTFLDLGQY
jgi:hypothetical protein